MKQRAESKTFHCDPSDIMSLLAHSCMCGLSSFSKYWGQCFQGNTFTDKDTTNIYFQPRRNVFNYDIHKTDQMH